MMEKEIKYSFVMPVFKGRYLNEAIDSILKQTFSSWELILVNDASPDNIAGIVKLYHDPRILYYENSENIGGKNLILNWNQCLKYANGQYLILASDDDVYNSDFLAHVDECTIKYPTVNLVRTRVQRIDSNGNTTDLDQLYEEWLSQMEFIFYWSKGWINCISNYVFKREALIEQKGFVDFPYAWFSDDASIIRMAKNGVVNTAEVLFSFRNSDISISWTFNVEVLKKKWKATIDFYYWFRTELSCIDDDEVLFSVYQNNAIFNVRNKVKKMFSYLIKEFPLSEMKYVLSILYKDTILYKKEKIHLLVDYLLK